MFINLYCIRRLEKKTRFTMAFAFENDEDQINDEDDLELEEEE
jgi:hypothetical protein